MLRINLTDLINKIQIEKGEQPLLTKFKGQYNIDNSTCEQARQIIETAIATYYNHIFTGEWQEIQSINQLPDFENIDVTANYDLEKLK